MSGDYTYWQKALAGEKPPIHEGDPQPGFYRKRNKQGEDDAVAIWTLDGEPMRGAIIDSEGNTRLCDPVEIWTWIGDKPITEETFRALERGEGWPDLPAGMGHNQPPSDVPASVIDEIEAATGAAKKELASPIKDEDHANRVANMRDRMRQLKNKADDQRKEEKKPHDEAGKAVQAKWKPVIDQADKMVTRLGDALTPWLKSQEAEKRKEAVERSIDQAAPTKAHAGGSLSGKRTGLKTTRSAIIEDQDKLYQAVRDFPEIKELLQTLANRAVRNGGAALPGTRLNEERKAA